MKAVSDDEFVAGQIKKERESLEPMIDGNKHRMTSAQNVRRSKTILKKIECAFFRCSRCMEVVVLREVLNSREASTPSCRIIDNEE